VSAIAKLCVRGVDVSSIQGDIDCVRLRDVGKLGFVVARATLGTTHDAFFTRNRAHAHAAGLRFGCYPVILAGDPIAQAAAFCDFVGALGPREWYSIDAETAGVTPDAIAAFATYCAARLGKRATLYSYGPFLEALHVVADHAIVVLDLWLAAYVSRVPSPPKPWTKIVMWQCWGDEGDPAVAREFGETGLPGAHLDGSGVHIDRDIFLGDDAAMDGWIDSLSLAQIPPPQAWQPDTPASPLRAEPIDDPTEDIP
jgi:GH25 family lysozyme M1 (1,4-beta-N-acetylmuramidase)